MFKRLFRGSQKLLLLTPLLFVGHTIGHTNKYLKLLPRNPPIVNLPLEAMDDPLYLRQHNRSIDIFVLVYKVNNAENLMDLHRVCATGFCNKEITSLELSSIIKKITSEKKNQIEVLSLKHNNLTSLPEEIKELKGLRELNLDNNQLTTLPEWIKELSELRQLSLIDNKFTIDEINRINQEVTDINTKREPSKELILIFCRKE